MNDLTRVYRIPILLSSGLGLILSGVVSYAADIEEIHLMTPANGIAASEGRQAAVKLEETYVRRMGGVILDRDALLSAATGSAQRAPRDIRFTNKRLALEVFPDVKLDIEVVAESRPDGGILTLHGRKGGKGLSTFALTITPESYIVTYDDPDTTKRYRIVGDTESGGGQVTEIDPKLLPATLDLPPLIPPSE